jgi:prepilin-type N-terminal cleavage/methylation domain-containing protein
MRRANMTAARRGMTIIELLFALVILGLFASAAVRLLLLQSSFYDRQLKQREARTVSRASVNVMVSELRMAESSGAVESVSADAITLRVPFAMGMFCGNSSGASVIALLPTDSTVLANAAPSGHAWRDVRGTYTYTNAAMTVAAANAAVCTAANITALSGGRVIAVTPVLPTSASAGDVVFLYQRLRYEFADSGVLPGRRALWRVIVDTGARDELAAPFDNSSGFRFFQFDRDTSDATANAADVRGIELVFDATSQTARAGAASAERAPLRTSVFFNNRVN